MAQYFYINQHSVLPTLRIELILDGRFEFFKARTFNNAIQNADVTFSMTDEDGILKISNAPCNIIMSNDSGCEQRYVLEYPWKARDTKKKGQFKGQFKIVFKGGLKDADEEKSIRNENGEWEKRTDYPVGDMIAPIYEDLIVMIK